MTDAPLANSFPHRTPKGPRKPRDPDAPAHYRLSTETWALVLAEYREGATAPELARKWRVSVHALRRQITQSGSSKRDWGDEQAVAQAAARAAAVAAGRYDSPEARAARLFDDLEREPDAAGDPVALARVAATASGRAMRGRLWAEARALTALAESYQRMAGQAHAREAGTLETLPLSSVFNVCMASEARLQARFHISTRPGARDPDRDLKENWWGMQQFREDLQTAQNDILGAVSAHGRRLEALMRAEGLTPPKLVLPDAILRGDADPARMSGAAGPGR